MKHVDMVPGSVALPLPDGDIVNRFETAYKVVLPEGYRHFLKHSGGGRPATRTFMAGGRQWVIDRFLCLLLDPEDHPLGEYDIGVTWSQLFDRLTSDPDGVGASMVPIAVLFAGDFVCLDYRASKDKPRTESQVVVWLHEQSEPFAPAVRRVCDTFTEFLELVR